MVQRVGVVVLEICRNYCNYCVYMGKLHHYYHHRGCTDEGIWDMIVCSQFMFCYVSWLVAFDDLIRVFRCDEFFHIYFVIQ